MQKSFVSDYVESLGRHNLFECTSLVSLVDTSVFWTKIIHVFYSFRVSESFSNRTADTRTDGKSEDIVSFGECW